MQYEIGLIISIDGLASHIIGPFNNILDASKEASKHNVEENRRYSDYPHWVLARANTILRTKDCIIEAPKGN